MSFSKPGKITIEIEGIKNEKGSVILYLYRGENGFPTDPKNALKKAVIPARTSPCTFSFSDIPAGTYAVSLFHDENNNGTLDTNFLGIPREGVGISNNAKGHLGPPKYADAKFQHQDVETKLQIFTSY